MRLGVICLAFTLVNVAVPAQQPDLLSEVRTLLLQGNLAEAQSLAELQVEQQVVQNNRNKHLAVSLYL